MREKREYSRRNEKKKTEKVDTVERKQKRMTIREYDAKRRKRKEERKKKKQ